MAAESGLPQNCHYIIEYTGGSIAKELDNQVCRCREKEIGRKRERGRKLRQSVEKGEEEREVESLC